MRLWLNLNEYNVTKYWYENRYARVQIQMQWISITTINLHLICFNLSRYGDVIIITSACF
jgi:hypothetical protein